MQTCPFGPLEPVSALTLGGGGLGQVWGATTRDEAIATVHEAIAGGITLLDMAPSYGRDGEAERVIGEAFGGRLPAGVRVTTKHVLGSPHAGDVYQRLSDSLDGSLARMRLGRVDIFILHGMIDAAAEEGATTRTNFALFRDSVVPAFERLRAEGRIGSWGITGVGFPSAILDVLEQGPRPAVVQCIANVLDSPGGMKRYDEPARPRDIIASAVRHGVGVMGIRAVAAGSLTSAIDRELPAGSPEVNDFERAAPFRAIAAELGVSPAFLAHQYALSMDGVSTVVLGVKNREELRECLAAEAAGPLPAEVTRRLDAALR
ncbi:MAG: aldo/keto reductase [Dehalococcoidia bacterium]|nr:aldo/keto reductase [Dehalococcoidia bacterium]